LPAPPARLAALALMLLAACAPDQSGSPPAAPASKPAMNNPVFHFEIPVTDMERAIAFYEAVFGYTLTREVVDGYDMAFFPRADGQPGASGALARGDAYRPSHDGPVIYFDVADIDAVLARASARGSRVLYPKKDIGAAGFVAEIADSEGNRIALSQAR
jgi:predicted enzyme related to lactoylglutathione lyase